MSCDPVFIGGLMKSGTSLVRKLLSRHPNIFAGLETHWFSPDIVKDWQDSDSIRQVWLREFFDVTKKEFEQIKIMSNSGTDFFTRFMWFCTKRAGKIRWAEKSPDNILYLSLIWDNWPASNVIHVVRDYRDVYASWKRSDKSSLPEFLEKVHSIMGVIQKFAEKNSKSYFEVKYEELVTSTEITLQGILENIGEEWVGGLDQYPGDMWDYQKVLNVTGKESPTTISLGKPIFATSVGQWKEILTSYEVATIEKELGAYMRIWEWM